MSEILCPQCAAPLSDGADEVCPRCLLSGFLFHESEGEPLEGVRFGEYELRERVASGGMGVVYQAWHSELHRLVALKMLKSGRLADVAERQRFATEAEAVAQLDHPGIVPIYEVGECEGQPFYTMRLVEGGRSGVELSKAKPVDFRRVATTLAEVARAVHFAHQRGILHRDLKPANILLDEAGRAFIIDFGLAKFTDAHTAITLSGMVLGTPAYMAPEVAADGARAATVAADVYSLGSLLYEWTTGRPPFTAETTMEMLRRIAQEEPRRPSALNARLPRDLETICLKCLRKQPDNRYASADALADDLDHWLHGEPITARPVATWERVLRWCRRRPAAAALIAVSIAAGGAMGLQFRASNLQLAEDRHDRELERAAATSERESQQSAYFSQILAASHARLAGDYVLARRLLHEQEPTQGRVDFRGLEWNLMVKACESCPPLFTFKAKGTVTSLVMLKDGRHLLATDGSGVHAWDIYGGACKVVAPKALHHTEASAYDLSLAVMNRAPAGPGLLKPPGWDRHLLGFADEDPASDWPVWRFCLGPVWHGIQALEPPGTWSDWTFDDFEAATRPNTDLLEGCTRMLAERDGAWVAFATARHGTSIWVCPGHTGQKLLAVLPGENARMAMSGDGRRLLVRTVCAGSNSEETTEAVGILYDTTTWLPVRIFPHCGWPMALNHDGTRLAAAPPRGAAAVFDTATGSETCRLADGGGRTVIVFNDRGTRIASADGDGRAVVHDAETGARISRLDVDCGRLSALAWRDDLGLATGWDKNLVSAWTADWHPLRDALSHEMAVSSLCWTMHSTLVSGGEDGRILGQDLLKVIYVNPLPVGPPLLILPGSHLIAGMTRDGKYALGDPVTRKFPGDGKPYEVPPESVLLGLSRNGTSAMFLQHEKATGEVRFRQIDARTGAPESNVALKDALPDGQYVASRSAAILAAIENPRLVALWNGITGERIPSLRVEMDVTRILLSPDATVLYHFSDSRWAALPVAGGAEIWNMPFPGTTISRSSFTADLSLFAASMQDGSIDLYSFRDGRITSRLTGHSTAALPCAFTPDGTRLISCSGACDIKIWDIAGQREIAILGPLSEFPKSVAVTGDGKSLILSDFKGNAITCP